MILFCEITPKIISINSYENISKKVFPFLIFFHSLFKPLRTLLLFVTEILIKIFKLSVKSDHITEDELALAVSVGQKEGVIERDEGNYIKNVIRFSKKEASNIMFPRNMAVFIPYESTIDEAMDVFMDSEVIRAPVYKGDLDHVVGLIDSRELISSHMGYKKSKTIKKYIHDIEFFPASRELNDLLNDFLGKRIQMAIVVDEYGGTAGVVTLNSILSELMGKEFSKFDTVYKPDIRRINDSTYAISGDMQIDDFNVHFKTSISSSNADTIGGYIIEQTGDFPSRGEKINIENYVLRVKYVRKNRIISVEVISNG